MALTPVCLVGPTATGKTALAVALGRALGDAHLVSLDAMAVYRGLDIGTAKPTGDERAGLVWHGLDLADPSEEFTVVRFREIVTATISTIEASACRPILVGGTGLYHRALVDSLEIPARFPVIAAALEARVEREGLEVLVDELRRLDPLAASRIEPGNRRRVVRALEVCLGSGRRFSDSGPGLEVYPPTRFLTIGLELDRAELDRRIVARIDAQLEAGLLDEVRALAGSPGGLSRTARQALGYKELLAYLEGELSLRAAIEEFVRRTRSFARRQEAWFRRDPRIVWLAADRDDLAEAAAQVIERADRLGPDAARE